MRDAAGLEREAYGLVLGLDVVHDLARPYETLRAIHGSLRPGGLLLMAEHALSHRPEELRPGIDLIERDLANVAIASKYVGGSQVVNRPLRRRLVSRVSSIAVGLVISPSHHLLDQHLQRGFFRNAIQQILPYGIEPVARLRSTDHVVIRSAAAESDFLAIVEAFQSGAVVILTRSAGASEVVRDGVNGLLVEPGDEAGIAAAVERLRQSPGLAARLRAAALETARFYDMRFHTTHLTAAYRQLLNASRAGGLDRRAA